MLSRIHPLIVLALGALCVSWAAPFVKLLKGGELGPTVIGFWRGAIGASIFFLWAIIKGSSLRLPWPVFWLATAAGFVFYLDLYFWHRSINIVGAGMATILANTQVFVTAVLGFLVFKDRPRALFYVAAAAGVGGVALLAGIGSDIHFDAHYLSGIGFGLATGIVFGSYIILVKAAGQRWGEKADFVVIMAWTSLSTGFFLFLTALVEGGEMWPQDTYSWSVLVALALVCQVIGWWLISSSLPRLAPSQSGLTILIQPSGATVWGILLFAEQFTILQALGAAITIGAIYFGSLRKSNTA